MQTIIALSTIIATLSILSIVLIVNLNKAKKSIVCKRTNDSYDITEMLKEEAGTPQWLLEYESVTLNIETITTAGKESPKVSSKVSVCCSEYYVDDEEDDYDSF